jgi:hypothetical protein
MKIMRINAAKKGGIAAGDTEDITRELEVGDDGELDVE